MASSVSLDQLVVDFLRKRGFLKTLKSFISETGLKGDSGNLVQEDLTAIFSAYLSSKTGGVSKKRKTKDQGSKELAEKHSKILPVLSKHASSSDEDEEDDHGVSKNKSKEITGKIQLKKLTESKLKVSNAESLKEATRNGKNMIKAVKPEAKVTDSSSDDSEGEDEGTPTAVVSNGTMTVKDAETTTSTSSDEDEDEDEVDEVVDTAVKVATGATAATVNEVESSSDDSSSDSDDEEGTVKPVAVVPKVKAAIASKVEEESEEESSESEDEAVKEPQVQRSEAKTEVVPSTKRESGLSAPVTVVPAVKGAARVAVEDSDESSSDSSSDEEEDIMQDVAVKGTSTVVPDKVVLPKVSTAEISECSDSSSDEEMEVPQDLATTLALVNKPVAANNKQTDSSSSDSSSDDEDEEPVMRKPAKLTTANGSEANLIAAASTAKKNITSSLSSSDSSDSEADDENIPARKSNTPGGLVPVQTSMPTSGVKEITSPASLSEEEDESSDESVEIKSTGGAGLGRAIKASSSDNSSDSSDEEATKPSLKSREGKAAVSHDLGVSAHKGSVQVTSANQGTRKEDKKDVKKQLAIDSTVKKGKKSHKMVSPQKDVEMADTSKTVANTPMEVDPHHKNGLTGNPSSKKRKPVEKGADVSPANKKAKVEEVVNGELNSAGDNKGEEFTKNSLPEKTNKSAQSKPLVSASKDTPTGAKAFQRVNPAEVQLLDPRLSDNSYWAKSGAEDGWGAKAQEVLGQVRGKNFRHEKTKKKRGSYKGGVIDHQSHSIKFANSDDE